MIRIALAAALLALSAPAAAGTLTTPPVTAAGSSSASCTVLNADTQPRSITARMFYGNGTLAGVNADVLVASHGAETLLTSAGTNVFCEFDGLTKKVRGYIELRDADGTRFQLLATK